MTTKPKSHIAPAADPIFALIEKHRAVLALRDSLGLATEDGNPEYEEADDVELRLWRKLVKTTPKTLTGLAAFAKCVDSYSGGDDEACQAISTIAKALRSLAQEASPRKPSAVAKALARCKAAETAYSAAEAAEDEAARERHGEAEMEIFDELAASDIEFIEKLRYMIAHETGILGSPLDSRAEFRHIAAAAAAHLGRPHDQSASPQLPPHEASRGPWGATSNVLNGRALSPYPPQNV